MGDLTALNAVLQQRVLAARRGHFLAADDSDDPGGFLELTLGSGRVLVLDVGGDWTLVVRPGPWRDDFAEPLTDENRHFVETHGKWSAVDVSAELTAALVGSVIESASLLHNEVGEVYGVRLGTAAGAVIRAAGWAGELQVEVERG